MHFIIDVSVIYISVNCLKGKNQDAKHQYSIISGY